MRLGPCHVFVETELLGKAFDGAPLRSDGRRWPRFHHLFEARACRINPMRHFNQSTNCSWPARVALHYPDLAFIKYSVAIGAKKLYGAKVYWEKIGAPYTVYAGCELSRTEGGPHRVLGQAQKNAG
jgi:hypothetical protein